MRCPLNSNGWLIRLELQPLPTVPIRPDDPESVVNLKTVLDEVFDRARFDLAIDYSQPLTPGLTPD